MVQPKNLILIGYWHGPQTDHSWPSPEDFVDTSWADDDDDDDDREDIVS